MSKYTNNRNHVIAAAEGFRCIERALTEIAEHYAKSAPVVATWMDAIAIDLADRKPVSVQEVYQALGLFDGNEWLHPSFAANIAYKAASAAGRDVTGWAGF